MNPRLRVALAAVPVVSVGLLAWLPFLWLHFARPGAGRNYAALTAYSFVGTLCPVLMILGGGDNTFARGFGGCLLLFDIAACTAIAWLTAGESYPAKDPYA